MTEKNRKVKEDEDFVCSHVHGPCEPEDGHSHTHGKGHGHDHSHIGHGHKVKARRLLLASMTITGLTMVVEFFGGWWTNSLALMSDAGHMLTHFLALGLSYGAILIASRESSPDYSFGFYRSETLAALFNAFFLLIISAFIIWEAYNKLLDPGPILVFEMFLVAVLGLVVNIVTALLLMRANPESDLNIQGAFLHMIFDTFSSVGVVIGAVVIYYTGWVVVDPLLSVLITVMILLWVYKLIRSSIRILLERVPEHMSVSKIVRAIKSKVPEVKEIHDMHIWEITTNMYNMTAHIVLDDLRLHDAMPLISKVKRIVKRDFNIGHAIIQLECTCYEDDSTVTKDRSQARPARSTPP